MSQDIVSDALNELMNAKKARKTTVLVKKHSKLLRNILDIAKEAGYLDYSIDGNEMSIEIKNLSEIKAIKPRFTVSVKKINDYTRRFLPAKNYGFLIISTNQGLMKSDEAEEKKLGGCLIAYVY
jgi:small subunit ribosomal protein S8